MPLPLQAKLLRVLEDGRVRRLGSSRDVEVDVRMIAATNKDLQQMVRDGEFREDLFFRVNVLHLQLPPLRDRLDDLPELCGALVATANAAHGSQITGLDLDAMNALRRHAWPGNVRELRNVVERAAILARAGEITTAHLPPGFGGLPAPAPRRELGTVPTVTLTAGTSVEQAVRELIAITLAHTGHNQTKAAELLGITPKTLYNKLKEYGSRFPDS
jgi:DNA-binding NtrC family response regulator